MRLVQMMFCYERSTQVIRPYCLVLLLVVVAGSQSLDAGDGVPRGFPDCNLNGTDDAIDISSGVSRDCNTNGIPDECDIDPTDPDGNSEVLPDCDGNGVPDACDLSRPAHIYWSQSDVIRRVDLDGTNASDVITTGGGLNAAADKLVVDPVAEKIYWISNNGFIIQRANFDGSAVETVVQNTGFGIDSLALDRVNGKLYWGLQAFDQAIRRSNLDGSDVEDVLTTPFILVQDIALDPVNEIIYWTNSFDIFSLNYDGSGNTTIYSGSNCDNLAVDNQVGKLFWTELSLSLQPGIRKANLDGSGEQLVLQNRFDQDVVLFRGLELVNSAKSIYWYDPATDAIRRANYDGSNIESITTVLDVLDVAVVVPSGDCNSNGVPDQCDLSDLTSPDCNANGIPDECEADCNQNNVPDDCDIDPSDPDGNGMSSADCNANGVPDECDLAPIAVTEIIDSSGDGAGNALDNPRVIAVGPNFSVYVAGEGSDNAFKIAPDGNVSEIIDFTGDGSGAQLSQPSSIAVDAFDNVYVAGGLSSNVFKIAPDGSISEIVDSSGDGMGATISLLHQIAVDPFGNVYVAGRISNNVLKITPDGFVSEIVDISGDGIGGILLEPSHIAFDAAGNVYVTGLASDNAFQITSTGVITEIIDATGDGQGNTLNTPRGIAVDAAANVYVVGSNSDNVFKITPARDISQIVGPSGDGMGNTLNRPWGIVVDALGSIFVSGNTSRNVFQISSSGAITEIVNDDGGAFTSPRGLAIDSRGDLYVAGGFGDNAYRIDVPVPDCNANNIPDSCDVDPADTDGDGMVSADCNDNGVPDECEEDCNANGIIDVCEFEQLLWADNFDSYSDGTFIAGQGGWENWDNDPAFDTLVTDALSRSAPNALLIEGAADVVQRFSGATAGQWRLVCWQYIPASFTGDSYVLVLNTYNPGGPNNASTVVRFNGEFGAILSEGDYSPVLPIVFDRWVELRLDIDLDADSQTLFYDGVPVVTKSWTEGVSGGGVPMIDTLDLFGNGASVVYYDDISLVELDDDCNEDGVHDECEITAGLSDDCNGNGLPDECELADNDCNANNIPDDCELPGNDCNANGVLDECDAAPFDFFDGFDSYADMAGLHGQGGWKGFANNPFIDALVTSAQANSAPHSLEITGDTDIVREFPEAYLGRWTVTAQTYIPSASQGEIVLQLWNTYSDDGPFNASLRVRLDGDDGNARTEPVDQLVPLLTDQWVEVRVEIDLEADTQTSFYNGQELGASSWTAGLSGGGGATRLDALELFPLGNGLGYVDDVSLVKADNDCNDDGTPDECDSDCNRNGVPDGCELPMLYWASNTGNEIFRANTSELAAESLMLGQQFPFDVAIDALASKLYWVDSGGNVRRANLDGSSAELLHSNSGELFFGIALDVPAGKMYWTVTGVPSRIVRANLDGSQVETVVSGLQMPVGIAIDSIGSHVYWTDNSSSLIQRANLDGSNIETLVSDGLSGPVAIALDVAGGHMYWTSPTSGKIQRANLDGSSVEDLIPLSQSLPAGIALDIAAGEMYWTDQFDYSIRRANLDGTNVEILITATGISFRPDGIALYLPSDCNANGVPDECEFIDPFTYQRDDGSGDLEYDLLNEDVLWVNPFTVQTGDELVSSISMAWGPFFPDGTPATVLLYDDPNNDGDPDDAVLLASVGFTGEYFGPDVFTTVAIPPTVVGAAGDSFFAGVTTSVTSGSPIVADTSPSPGQQTWYATAPLGSIDINDLSNNSELLSPNGRVWMVRVGTGTSVDCNNNGIPDECETTADCNNDGLLDVCQPDFVDCNDNGVLDSCDIAEATSPDCNMDGIPDECSVCDGLQLEVVLVMDTSPSLNAYADEICLTVPQLVSDFANEGVNLDLTILGITETPWPCIDDSIVNAYGAAVPGDGSCGPLDDFSTPGVPAVALAENWGAGAAVVADSHPWPVGAKRLIISIADEGPCYGNPCDDPGPDRDSISNAITVARLNHVKASSLLLSAPSPSCVAGLAEDLANQTGGSVQEIGLPPQVLAALEAIIRQACTRDDCNQNGVLDECEAFVDCNNNGLFDACDIANGLSEDCDNDGLLDICEPGNDCNLNGIADYCEIFDGSLQDCDGDGLPDPCAITVQWDINEISNATDYATDIFLGDLDGDDDLDVVTTSFNSGRIAWHENLDGLGTFGPEQVIYGAAASANSVHVVDVDGDMDNDVVAGWAGDDTVAWFENLDGLGTFGPPISITTLAAGVQSVFATDIDSDSNPDILSASFSDNKIAWYENTDGLGSFGAQQVISSNMNGAQAAIAVDVDGDTFIDVVAVSFDDDKVSWFKNTDGLGTFGTEVVISNVAAGATDVIAFDADGDTDIDLAVAVSGDQQIVWYENLDGLGTFGGPQLVTNLVDGVQALAAADIDGDGDLDLLSASFQDDDVAWYENTDGLGTFGFKQIVAERNGAAGVVAGDIDSDGDNDVVSCSWFADDVTWYRNTGENDCNGNGVPDECELMDNDCNTNGVPDDCELTDNDCNFNGVPDDCEDNITDCNNNGWIDLCELAAPQASFVALGDLPGGQTFSAANGVSADGNVVVGHTRVDEGREAFVWTPETGMFGIGEIPGGAFFSSLRRVSSDGLTAVGWAEASVGQVAIRWTASEGIVVLGPAPDGSINAVANDVSADGSFIAGRANYDGNRIATRWPSDDVEENLGELPGGTDFSNMWSISADGTAAAGYSSGGAGQEAILWREGVGLVGLGELPGGAFDSQAFDVSADGTVVVGESISSNGREAFRWTESTGMVGLGDLPGGSFSSFARGVSNDGSVVVGSGTTDAGPEAFIWTEETGMLSLQDLLVNNYGLDLTGWQLTLAWDASPDGQIIVGIGENPVGDREGFRAIYNPNPRDCNNNGILDECETADPSCLCDGIPDNCPSDCDGFERGDVDESGAVNIGDISAFAGVLVAPESASMTALCTADVNEDENVDGTDIAVLIVLLVGS